MNPGMVNISKLEELLAPRFMSTVISLITSEPSLDTMEP